MIDYDVFGGRLRSDIVLPELAVATRPGEVDWTVRVVDAPLVDGDPGVCLGTDPVRDHSDVRLYALAKGHVLRYGDTGDWFVSSNGAEVLWHPPVATSLPEARFEEALRIDLLGRVMALALHCGGRLVLHGSAVALDGRAIAFLAPKYHGKSTLAGSLVAAGARLVTDDLLPVLVSGSEAWAEPGVHTVRAWPDSAEHLNRNRFETGAFGKLHAIDLPTDARQLSRLPLSAIYLITPVRADVGLPSVQRTRLDSVVGALQLVAHGRLGPLLSGSEAAAAFDRAARVADAVPLYALAVARAFDQLPDVVSQLLSWHAGSAVRSVDA